MQSDADTNQHYVSQFMLRGFHTGNEAQIWVFDKMTSRSYTDAIKNVASEYGFYNIAGSADIDERIRKIEDATAPIIQEIRTRKTLRSLTEDKRIWLSGFTALQPPYQRVQRTRTRHDAPNYKCGHEGEQRQALKENSEATGTGRAWISSRENHGDVGLATALLY